MHAEHYIETYQYQSSSKEIFNVENSMDNSAFNACLLVLFRARLKAIFGIRVETRGGTNTTGTR